MLWDKIAARVAYKQGWPEHLAQAHEACIVQIHKFASSIFDANRDVRARQDERGEKKAT